IAAAAVPSLELRAAVDEQLHDVVASLECGTDERRATLAVTVIRIESEVEQHPYGFQIVLRRSLVGDAFDPANASRRGQRGVAVLSRDERIGAVVEQQLHQLDVARLTGAHERRRAVFM